MRITLMRHGKPAIDSALVAGPAKFVAWMEEYDRVPLDGSHRPPELSIQVAAASAFVVCSDLSRSLESARMLGVRDVRLSHARFREVTMPGAPFSRPRFTMRTWVMLFRGLQLLGYCGGAESLREARQRADRCACELIELAQQHSHVLLVGHAALNYLIAGALMRRGWLGDGPRRQHYWGFIRFTLPGAQALEHERLAAE